MKSFHQLVFSVSRNSLQSRAPSHVIDDKEISLPQPMLEGVDPQSTFVSWKASGNSIASFRLTNPCSSANRTSSPTCLMPSSFLFHCSEQYDHLQDLAPFLFRCFWNSNWKFCTVILRDTDHRSAKIVQDLLDIGSDTDQPQILTFKASNEFKLSLIFRHLW